MRELWRRATAPEGRTGRWGWLCGALMVFGLAKVAALHVPEIERLLRSLGPWVQLAIATLGSAIAWMTPVFRQFTHGLDQLEAWQKQAEAVQATLPKDPTVI